jgi:hypothetical protein
MLLINFAVLHWTNDYVVFEGISTTIYISLLLTLIEQQSKVWEYLCRRSYYQQQQQQQQQQPSYYQQQQEQRRLELRDQKDYGNKDDPDRGFWTWANSIKGLQLLQEIQVKTTQIVQQNQQIIVLLTRLINTI